MSSTPTVLVDQLAFPECPRWHGGKLWFSDFQTRRVSRLDPETGAIEVIVEVPNRPAGLGWRPDGRMLVVSMNDRRLLSHDADGLHEVADLASLATFNCNDMVVDRLGRAYIGHMGFDVVQRAPFKPSVLILVDEHGNARAVAEDLAFPNGMAMTPDGRTLIVAETYASRLTAFDVRPDGGLENRRVWAELQDARPDGICLDAEGAVWYACPQNRAVIRVREGGEVTDRIPVATNAYACELGGADRRTLFICTAPLIGPEALARREGKIETVRVAVPGVGLE